MITCIPPWSFDVARFLAIKRHAHFKNRFTNRWLRQMHEGTSYMDYCEGIMGYLGDIAAAVLLGQDPLVVMLQTIVATRGLTGRDESDLVHCGKSIDVKIENLGSSHDAVLSGMADERMPYSCRLINAAQLAEGNRSDTYLFGAFDPPLAPSHLLHDAKSIAWVGHVSYQVVASIKPSVRTPTGAPLHVAAYAIRPSQLEPVETLLKPCSEPASRRTSMPRTFDPVTEQRIDDLSAGIRELAAEH